MARFSRTRTSRTIASVVVIVIVIGAAFQLHRNQKSKAVPPPLQMSVAQNALAQASKAPATNIPVATTTPPAVPTLVTQTPDPSKPLATGQSNLQTKFQAGAPKSAAPVNAAPAVKASAQLSPSGSASATAALADTAAKVNAGDLIGARTELNSVLVSGSLSDTDADAVKKQMAQINQTLIFSPRQFPRDPLGGVYEVKSGDRLASIGNAHLIPYELLLPLNRMTDARKLRYGQTLKVINGPFHGVVTKSKFTLDVYLGSPGGVDSTYITTFPVGLGTDNSTPTGTWSIRNKVTHPAYFPPEGHAGPVLAADDPKNPLGDYWMGLEGTDGQAMGQRSYGIHGTIDPSSIGRQSSMGCIRLKNEDVEVLYKMLMSGKSMVIVKD